MCDSGFFPAWVRSPSSQHAFRHRLLPPRLPLLQGARRGGWRRWGGTATGCTMARAAPACEWSPQLLCSWGRGLLPLLLMLRWCRGLCRDLQQGVVLPAADHCTALLHAHLCTPPAPAGSTGCRQHTPAWRATGPPLRAPAGASAASRRGRSWRCVRRGGGGESACLGRCYAEAVLPYTTAGPLAAACFKDFFL